MARKGNYGGQLAAYNSTAAAKVNLPETIRCRDCSKAKSPHCFSNKRLNELRTVIYENKTRFDPATSKVIPCTQCSGGQVTELFCNGCDKTKGLHAFAKTHRRDPDNAMCLSCMEDRLNMEPGGIDSDDDKGPSGGGFDSDESSGSENAGTTTVASGMSAMSLTNGSTGNSSGGVALASPGHTAYGRSAGGSTGGTKSVVTTSPSATTSAPTQDSFLAHLRKKGPASVAGSEASNDGSKFAKVKAVPRQIKTDLAERERKREAAKHEEDDVCVETSESDSD